MKNETYLDFCFIREEKGSFSTEIDLLLKEMFSSNQLHWYLDEKSEQGLEIVVAEVKGMSDWSSEEQLLSYLEDRGSSSFWTYLQGYQFSIYPYMKGCQSCGTHSFT